MGPAEAPRWKSAAPSFDDALPEDQTAVRVLYNLHRHGSESPRVYSVTRL